MTATARAARIGLERRFHALAEEKRLRILELLQGGERCVCEIGAALDLPQSLLSFHLKTLKDAGLVRDRRDGRWVYYAVDAEALEELEGYVASLTGGAVGPAGSAPGLDGRSCC